MYILFQLFFVLIDCSTILVPNFWYYWRYKSDKFSITVNGSSGWKWIFRLVFPWFGVPADTTWDSEFQVTFQPWFYYRIHFGKLQEEFSVSERFLQKPYWNCFYSTTEHRNATRTTYNEILVPYAPVLKIIMSILLSISGSTGFRV